MKNPYTIAALCLIGIAVFIKAGIANALLLFLLVGAIPGTSYNIPASTMLALLASPFVWIGLIRLGVLGLIHTRVEQYMTRSHVDSKKRIKQT